MIDTIIPHPLLKPFIRAYLHNMIDFTSDGGSRSYHFTPTHKKYVMLYLGSSVNVTFDGGITETKKDMLIIGPQTKPVTLLFEPQHRVIAIEMQNIGQFYLLGKCPIHTLMDCHIDGEAVFGNRTNELVERLSSTICPQTIKILLDDFFLEKLKQQNNAADGINVLLNQMPAGKSVADIAYAAGMSTRQLERHCKEKIGISPRLYNKIRRFADAYKLKEIHPEKTWTDIAHTCGYFDQMHLIRDFRSLSGHNPKFISEVLNNQYHAYTGL